MNKIFKVIWNHATQSWIVTSEISKSHGKTASGKSGGFAISHISGVRFAYTAVASTVLMMSMPAMAITGDFNFSPRNNCFFDYNTQSVICGDNTTSVQDLYGNGTSTNPTRISRSIALGQGAKVGDSFSRENSTDPIMYTDAVAIGTQAAANGFQSTAIGAQSSTSRRSTAIGYDADAGGYNPTTRAPDGELYGTAIGYKAKAPRSHSVAIGAGATVNALATTDTARSDAILQSNLSNGLIAGTTSASDSAGAVAIGREAKAGGYATIAQGLNANASAAFSTAIGANSIANKMETIAIGSRSEATGHRAIAIGSTFRQAEATVASGDNSIAMGAATNVSGANTTVIGSKNTPVDGKTLDANGGIVTATKGTSITATNSSIIGMSNQIAVSSVTASNPKTAAALTDVQVQGNNNTINRGRAYVFGSNNTINTNDTNMELESVVAVGRQNTVSGNNALAVGRLNQASGLASVALGLSSKALGQDGIAIGDKAYASEKENSVAIGGLTYAGQFGTALGARASVKGDQGLAAATGAVVEGARAVAVGSYSFAGTEDSVALGHNTAATGSRAVAIGAGSVVSGSLSGAWSIATNGGQPQNNTTDRSFVGGANSYAIGNKNIIGNTSSDSFVLGNNVKLGATGASITITNVAGKDGTTNASTRTNTVTYTDATAITGAVALGSDTSVTVNNGVALGKSSVAGTAAGQVGADPLSAVTDKTSAVWTSTLSAVSVGDIANNKTRQITSVAAGTQDTDAVNVAQLKAATTHYYSVNDNGTQGGNYNNNGATGKNALAAGVSASAATENSVAVGYNAQANTNTGALAIGSNTTSSGTSSVALGTNSSATGQSAVGVGNLAKASGQNTVAIGESANATGSGNVAIGESAGKAHSSPTQIQGNNTVLIGVAAGAEAANNQGQVSVGWQAGQGTLGAYNTASGTNAGRAVNGTGNIAMGHNAGSGTVTVNSDGTTIYTRLNINDTVALGTNAKANANDAVVIGKDAVVEKTKSTSAVVIGNGAKATSSTVTGSEDEGKDVVAIGYLAQTGASSNIALGSKATATGKSQAIAIGYSSNAVGYMATALGAGASVGDNGAGVAVGAASAVTGNFGVAVGNAAQATVANGVALGSNSVANVAAGQTGVDPLNAATDKTTSTWKATRAAVSVGGVLTKADGSTETLTRQITSVAAGTNDTDAVNVAQLKAAGFTLATSASDGEAEDKTAATATGADDKKIQNGETITVDAGKNIKVTQTGQTVSIATKDEVEFTQITLGDSTNNTVLTSTANGLDVGGDKITNVADGAADKDAVNVSQLKAAQAAATSKVEGNQGVTVTSATNNDGSTTYTVAAKTDGTTIKVDNSGNLTANTTTLVPATDGKVGTPTNPNALVTASDIANAINNSGFNLQANGDTASLVKAGDKVQFLNGDNIEITRNGNDITVATAKDVSFDSVTAGTGTNQVVLDNDGVKVGGNTYISNAGLNANDKKVTNVANGDVTSASKDAINGSQLHAVSTATKNLIGGNATVNPDGTVTASNIGGTTATTIDDAIKTVKTTVKSTDNTIKVTANTANANDGTVFDISVDSQKLAESAQLPVVYTKADGTKVYKVGNSFFDNKDGTGTAIDATDVIASMQNADGTTSTATKLANIAKGEVSSTSKDAINGSQLFAQGEGVKNIIGGTTTYDPATGTYTNNNIGGTGKGNINDAIQTVNTKADTNATEIAKGLNFGANDQTTTSNTAINRKLGDTIGIKGGITDTTTATSGENVITRTDANGNINIELAKNAKFDSVTTGGTKLSDAGLSFVDASGSPVANSPSISKTGINAGNQAIAGVKAGTNDTDAVNVSQLKGAVDALGGGAAINTDGTIKAPTYSITNPANGTVTTANNVGDALKGLNDAVNSPLTFKGDSGEFNRNLGQITTVKGGITDTTKLSDNNIGVVAKDGILTIKLAKDIAVDSVKAGNTTMNTYGISIANADPNKVVSLTGSGLNNGNNRITNVAAGQAGTDAVNKDQLDAAKASATTKVVEGKNVEVTEQTNTDGSKTYTVATADEVKFDKVTVGGVVVDGTSNKISGLANGDVSANSTDAINGSQLFATNQNVANNAAKIADNAALIAKGINFGGTTGSNNYALGNTINVKGDSNISSETVAGGVQLKLNDVVSIGTAKPVQIDGTKGTVGGLTNTTWDANNIVSGQAATEDQLKSAVAAAQAAATTKVVEGKNVKVSEQTNADGSKTYTVATADDVSFNSVTSGTGANQVVLNDKGVNVGGNTYISDAGLNANDKKVTNVANGDVTSTSKDAINGSQLHAVSTATKNLIGGNATVNSDGTVTASNIGGTGKNNINDAIEAVNTAATKAKTTVTQGKNIVVTESKNTDGSTNYQVATADNLDVTSVKAGNTTINNAGVTVGDKVALTDRGLSAGDVKVTTDGINAGGNKITGVAAGDISATSTDAVNGSQLNAVNQRILNIITGGKDDKYYDANGNLTEAGQLALKTYNVQGQSEFVHNSVVSAIKNINEQGTKFFHTNEGQSFTSEATNSEDSSAGGKYSTAIGYQAATTAAATNGLAVGTQSKAAGENAVALGYQAQANGTNTISIGTGNVVNGNNSGAIGDPSVIDGANSYSVGNNNSIAASSDNVFILGNDVNIAANTSGAVALGNKASVTTAGSVALGEGSTAGAANIAGGTANNAYTFGAYNDANVAAKPTTSTSVVAVGSKGNERQIQHVAAGVVSATSTDAINGSQLYYTNRALGKLADVVNKNNLDLRAGVAGANAAAGLPQVYLPGKSMVAASAGTYRGQSALAVGYSRSSDNGKLVLKVQGNANTRGEVGGSVGIGYQW